MKTNRYNRLSKVQMVTSYPIPAYDATYVKNAFQSFTSHLCKILLLKLPSLYKPVN